MRITKGRAAKGGFFYRMERIAGVAGMTDSSFVYCSGIGRTNIAKCSVTVWSELC